MSLIKETLQDIGTNDIIQMIDESRAFDEPEGKSLNIMHTRSVNFLNKVLKLLLQKG